MPAGSPVIPWLMLITDPVADIASVVRAVKGGLRGGVTHVLLRRPGASDGEIDSLARRLAPQVLDHGATLVIHGRPSIAAGIPGAGVHLPARALGEVIPAELAAPFGVSVHSVEEARSAQLAGADYVLFGHVFVTASHPGEPGRGPEVLHKTCEAVDVPVIAIGGIAVDHVEQVIAAGARGIAVQRAISDAPDPEQAARALRQALDAAQEMAG